MIIKIIIGLIIGYAAGIDKSIDDKLEQMESRFEVKNRAETFGTVVFIADLVYLFILFSNGFTEGLAGFIILFIGFGLGYRRR